MTFSIAAFAIITLAMPTGGANSPARPDVRLPAADIVRLIVAPDGNEARYRVREQFVKVDFPNDAIGVTPAVTGGITLDSSGNVVPAQSLITIDLRPLKSDKDRRDSYVQRRLLETDEFPTATLRVKAISGAPAPLPTTGEFEITLDGDLTIKGVTRATSWTGKATATPNGYTGSVQTRLTFEQFDLTKPRMSFLLSVEDEFALEYDFKLVRANSDS